MTGLELPLVLGIVAATAAVGTGVTSAVTGSIDSKNQAKLYQYNAEVDKVNALQQQENARFEEERLREQQRRSLGNMLAGYGKSGVTMSGSALDVLDDSLIQSELDALTVKYRGQLGFNAYNQSALDNQTKGLLAQQQGKTALTGGLIGTTFNAAGAFTSFAGNPFGKSGNAIPKGTKMSYSPEVSQFV
jgi:hypothetical protein